MSRICDAFTSKGRKLTEDEKGRVEQLRTKYKSALELIQEHLPPEDATKFHDRSRKPFDYEQPVIDAAKEAMGDKTWSQAPYNPPGIRGTLKTRHIVPQWLYENVGDIVKRVHDVEAFMHKTTWVTNDLQVDCSADLFESIENDDTFKRSYQWYTTKSEGVTIESGEQWLKKKRWVRISRTLFVVEE